MSSARALLARQLQRRRHELDLLDEHAALIHAIAQALRQITSDRSEAITLVRQLRAGGLDLLNVSMGFSTPAANIPWGPALLAPVAQRVRREAGLPVAASWGIDAPELAERMVAEEMMDLVMVGRAHLANPHWPYATAWHSASPTRHGCYLRPTHIGWPAIAQLRPSEKVMRTASVTRRRYGFRSSVTGSETCRTGTVSTAS